MLSTKFNILKYFQYPLHDPFLKSIHNRTYQDTLNLSWLHFSQLYNTIYISIYLPFTITIIQSLFASIAIKLLSTIFPLSVNITKFVSLSPDYTTPHYIITHFNLSSTIAIDIHSLMLSPTFNILKYFTPHPLIIDPWASYEHKRERLPLTLPIKPNQNKRLPITKWSSSLSTNTSTIIFSSWHSSTSV